MEERKCQYRNCGKDITEMRSNAKFCSSNCKGCEGKYKRRRKQQFQNYKSKDMQIVESVKRLKDIIKMEDKK